MRENVRRAYLFGAGMLLGAVMLMDVVTTTFILGAGGVELNPVMVAFVANPYLHFGLKLATIGFFLMMSAWCDLKVKGTGALALFVAGAAFLPAVVNNLMVLGAVF